MSSKCIIYLRCKTTRMHKTYRWSEPSLSRTNTWAVRNNVVVVTIFVTISVVSFQREMHVLVRPRRIKQENREVKLRDSGTSTAYSRTAKIFFKCDQNRVQALRYVRNYYGLVLFF